MTTVFILDSKCNLSCEFCICNGEKRLNSEEIKSKLDSCSGRVIFTGGEPLLREDINELCEYAKSKNLRVGVHTNAILLKRLDLNYVDFVNLPLDGPEKIHNELRGDNFDTIMKALDKLKEKTVKITTIATKINLDEIKRIPEILEKYPNIKLWRVFKYKGEQDKFIILAEEFNQLKTLKAHCQTEFIDDIDNFGKWEKVEN
jgi:MoaA/NifB/PqqE/SkfB family radical SAM enzyme